MKEITAEELKKRLAEGEEIVLIDTRTEEEREAGYISGSILIPFDEMSERCEELDYDKDAMIVVYCRSGNRSSYAASYLEKCGFTNVYNLVGGMLEW